MRFRRCLLLVCIALFPYCALAANPMYDPHWTVGDLFLVRFDFTLQQDRKHPEPSDPPIPVSVVYAYTVTALQTENGHNVAKILATPQHDGWSQWVLTLDRDAITLLTVEEVIGTGTIAYTNPFGGDAWLSKLDQYHLIIDHDFPKIPSTNTDEIRVIDGGQSSTPSFTQSVFFGPSSATVSLSRIDPESGLIHRDTFVWNSGAKWWSTAQITLGAAVKVTGTLQP